MHSDGGGKALATVNPLFGADRVARSLSVLGQAQVGQRVFSLCLEDENWLLIVEGDAVITGICATERDGQIIDLFVHRNPDKLARFAAVLVDAVEVDFANKKAG